MKRQWTPEELVEHWTVSEKERTELLDRRKVASRWALTIALKHYDLVGRFPRSVRDVPETVARFVAEQHGVTLLGIIAFDWNGRTAKRHRQEILAFLGMRRATPRDRQERRAWLLAEVLPHDVRRESVLERIQDWHRDRSIALPSLASLDRLIRSLSHRYEIDIMRRICGRLGRERAIAVQALLDEGVECGLSDLKVDPGRASVESLERCATRLRRVKGIGLTSGMFDGIPSVWLEAFRKRIAGETVWEVRRHPEVVQTALVATFCWLTQQRLSDDLIELLIALIRKISTRAEKKIQASLVKEIHVQGKRQLFSRVASLLIANPDRRIREVVFPVVSEEVLQAVVREADTNGSSYEQQVHSVVRSSYQHHYRRMLQIVVEALEFHASNPRHRAVVEALAWLLEHRDDRRQFIPMADVPSKHLIEGHWEKIVLDDSTDHPPRVNRINYEICVLNGLRAGLKCKAIWAEGAYQFRDPDEDLPQDFETRRPFYFDQIDQPLKTLPSSLHTFV